MVKLSRKQRRRAKRHQLKKSEVSKNTETTSKIYPKFERRDGLFTKIYKHNYKILLLIPFLMLVLAIAQISFQVASTGDFIQKGVSLKGGVTITLFGQYDVSPLDLESYLTNSIGDDVSVRLLKKTGIESGYIIDGPIGSEQKILKALPGKLGEISKDDYTIEETGSSLGQSFFKETAISLVIAFILMGIVVFFYFRVFVPSAAVILAAFSDIVVTIAVINLLGVKVSTAGIAAFLMLIGYSVDTDILLSTRVIKNKAGTVFLRVVDAMKTGLTMSMTTLAAVTVGLFLAQSEALQQVMLILFIGLIVDVINTWIQNAGLLRLYFERKHHD